MYRDPARGTRSCRGCAACRADLNAQIAAGAQAVQLFDSWVGCLGPDDYRRYVLPYTCAIIEAITPGVPVINFATGNPALCGAASRGGGGMSSALIGASVWMTPGAPLGRTKEFKAISTRWCCWPNRPRFAAGPKQILDQAAGRPGHIFNLGHGVLRAHACRERDRTGRSGPRAGGSPRSNERATIHCRGRRVAVIGGGITGLAAAHRIAELRRTARSRCSRPATAWGASCIAKRQDELLCSNSVRITSSPTSPGPWTCAGESAWPINCSRRMTSSAALIVHRGQLYPVPEGFMLMEPRAYGRC